MSNVILIEDVEKKESNLEEFVYQKSKGGKEGLSLEDIKKIDPDQRMRAIHLLEIYSKHPETFKEKKIEAEEPKEIPKATSRDLELFYDDLPKEKKEVFLEELFASQIKASLTTNDNGLAALPDEVKEIINMPQEKWNKLPKNGRELILEKFTQF